MINNRNNKGTGFVNFNDILNANKQTGKRMGEVVAGGLESQAQAANQELDKQKQEFDSKYGDAVSKWSNTSQLANQLATKGSNQDWTGIANINNPDLSTAGTNFRNFKYTGPQGYANVSGLQAQGQSASDSARLANTSQGQQQLLRQYVGGQGYNQGQSQFDQALLNKYGRGDINQAKKASTGLSEQINKNIVGAQNSAQVQGRTIQSDQDRLNNELIAAFNGKPVAGTDPKSILGIGAAAKAQKEKDIARTQELLATGTTGTPNIDPNTYSDADRALLNNLGTDWQEYGVDTGKNYYNYSPSDMSLDPTNAGMARQGVQQIASNMNVGGNYLLDQTGQKAANNLAAFLGNTELTPEQYTDISKIFGGNLQNIIDTTVGTNERNATDRINSNNQRAQEWANAYSANNWNPWKSDNEGFQALDRKHINEGRGSLYAGLALAQVAQAKRDYQQRAKNESRAQSEASNRKLLAYLNGLGTNPIVPIDPSTSEDRTLNQV
jgi:hypothetical protein